MIGERLNKAINNQIKNELESYYIYLSMAAYFHSNSLDGMGHYMRCQAQEEMVHSMKFFEHVLEDKKPLYYHYHEVVALVKFL